MVRNRLLQYASQWVATNSEPGATDAALAPSPTAFVLIPVMALPAVACFAPAMPSAALYEAAYRQAREAVNRYWFGGDDPATD
jgi:hypothetical protein